MKPKIILFGTKPYEIKAFTCENSNEIFNYEIKYADFHLNIDTAKLAQGYNVAGVFVNDYVNKEIADTLYQNGIKLIALRSAGYSNVDLKAVYEKIPVVRVPEYSPHAIAEHTVAMMLALNRKIHRAYNRTRDNNFSIEGLMGFDMYAKTAGIIGTGKIGKVLVKILRGFGMRVLLNDKYPDADFAREIGAEYVGLEELMSNSDIISLNCPLTPETVHLISEGSISQMKEGVMIINTGRGKLINSRALIQGLKNQKIGSAGLDVYEEESDYFFEDLSNSFIADDVLARLLSFPNVLITSHQGYFTKEATTNIALTTLHNIKNYFENEKLTNEVCYHCQA